MRTFLSIDLDYWFYINYEDHVIDRMMIDCLQFFVKLSKIKQSYSINLIVNHENILPILKTTAFDKLINIDYHDDICGEDFNKINCGTWVRFVSGRETKLYNWKYPVSSCKDFLSNGRCDTDIDLWRDTDKTNWNVIRKGMGLPSLKNIELEGICIVLSPPWIHKRIDIYKMGNILKGILQ